MAQKILIYDCEFGGHHFEFVAHLLNFFSKDKVTFVSFLIHRKTILHLEKEINEATNTNKKILIHPIEEQWENIFVKEPSELKKSLKEKKLLELYINKFNIELLILLQMDSLQYIIGTWRFSAFKNVQIKGIFFQPHVQEPYTNYVSIFRRIRKRLQLHWMFLNTSVKKVFILNDLIAVKQLNDKILLPKKFSYIVDPVDLKKYDVVNLKSKYNIGDNKKILLVIGGIQRRKNIINIIDAISLLSDVEKEEVFFLILGVCNDKQLASKIEEKLSLLNGVKYRFENEFINNNIFETAISLADIVFTLYSDFYASSGILGNVAKHGTYLISSNKGIISRLTLEYKLGDTIDENNILDLNRLIRKQVSLKKEKIPNIKYINYHTVKEFCETLSLDPIFTND
jgi:glycosyltransferase involved in cell wall biosynthesis